MSENLNTETENKKSELNFKDSKYATGRRKTSIAKVWVKKGSGSIYVNGIKMSEYFKKANLQTAIYRPLTVTKRENEFDVKCSVNGGGLSGQAGAIILGISANGFLKTTNGFTNIFPTIFCVVSIISCLFCLSKAMNIIPVGFTYATYGGLTITAVTIFGIFKYNQLPNIYGIIGIILIIIGVILVNYLGKINP